MKVLLLKKGGGGVERIYRGDQLKSKEARRSGPSVTVYGDEIVALVYYDECGESCII